jgi:hypothetical protein
LPAPSIGRLVLLRVGLILRRRLARLALGLRFGLVVLARLGIALVVLAAEPLRDVLRVLGDVALLLGDLVGIGLRVLGLGASDLLARLDSLDRLDRLLNLLDLPTNALGLVLRFEDGQNLLERRDELRVLAEQCVEVAAVGVLRAKPLHHVLEEVLNALLLDQFEPGAERLGAIAVVRVIALLPALRQSEHLIRELLEEFEVLLLRPLDPVRIGAPGTGRRLGRHDRGECDETDQDRDGQLRDGQQSAGHGELLPERGANCS